MPPLPCLLTLEDPDDIILGPPKTSFASATSQRNSAKPFDSPDRPTVSRDVDSRDRFNFQKSRELENDRSRGGRIGDARMKRDGDQDSDGWSTVKPRKSFGTEGAERFNGRMGVDRQREDRRFRDRDDRDAKDRPRGFETFSREKELEIEQDSSRRNGGGRGRNEPSWFKDNTEAPPTGGDRKSNGDRFADRSRGWREKDRDDKPPDRGNDRDDRGDRRWGARDGRDGRDNRDTRQERDPEWMDEPERDKKQSHTQEDFQKWKEMMKATTGGTPADETPLKPEMGDLSGQNSFFGFEKPKVETPLVVDAGPDKFFGMWAQAKAESTSDGPMGAKTEGVVKAPTVGKSSRFASVFARPAEDAPRRQIEPPLPAAALPPKESEKEKEDFQKLLEKLKGQGFGFSTPTPPANQALQPQPPPQEKQSTTPLPPDQHFQQYRPERQEPSRTGNRDSQQALQDLLAQRQAASSQPVPGPQQMLHDLVNQRQNAMSQSSSRPEQVPNRNAEFLMGLMQNARTAPEPLRSEQLMMRNQPQHADRQMQQMADREQEMHREREQRERSASQRQQRRPDLPPGFFDESQFQRGPPQQDRSQGPPQPTQILQRPPPGLDQQPPPGWGAPNGQLPPPMSQRHIAPPPGLVGARGMPMPQGMFPPFPAMGFAPPDGMGPPPRNMQPPPGFMMPLPPGFMGPPMGAFPGPEGMAYGPFDGRGAPPQQGNFRRQ
jgi:hypothetical protein